jgi:hypothetical protein
MQRKNKARLLTPPKHRHLQKEQLLSDGGVRTGRRKKLRALQTASLAVGSARGSGKKKDLVWGLAQNKKFARIAALVGTGLAVALLASKTMKPAKLQQTLAKTGVAQEIRQTTTNVQKIVDGFKTDPLGALQKLADLPEITPLIAIHFPNASDETVIVTADKDLVKKAFENVRKATIENKNNNIMKLMDLRINGRVAIPRGNVTLAQTRKQGSQEIITCGEFPETYAKPDQTGLWHLYMPITLFDCVKKNIHSGAFGGDVEDYTQTYKDIWKLPADLLAIQEYKPPKDIICSVGNYGGYTKYRLDGANGSVHWLMNDRGKKYGMISTSVFFVDFNNPTDEEQSKVASMIYKLKKHHIKAEYMDYHHAIAIYHAPSKMPELLCSPEIKTILVEAASARGYKNELKIPKDEIDSLCNNWQNYSFFHSLV